MIKHESNIAHREVLMLELSPARAREFIMTPERILDYYPGGIGGGVFEAGRSIYCHSDGVISLLERVTDEGENPLTILVTSAPLGEPPYTAEGIKSSAFFTMLEDWQLEEEGAGTRLTKTWRDITTAQPDMDMDAIVRESAKEEGENLVAGWNAAAKA